MGALGLHPRDDIDTKPIISYPEAAIVTVSVLGFAWGAWAAIGLHDSYHQNSETCTTFRGSAAAIELRESFPEVSRVEIRGWNCRL